MQSNRRARMGSERGDRHAGLPFRFLVKFAGAQAMTFATEVATSELTEVELAEVLARDAKIHMVYEELTLRGERYNESVRLLSKRFDSSPSTVKRAIRRFSPASQARDAIRGQAACERARPCDGSSPRAGRRRRD